MNEEFWIRLLLSCALLLGTAPAHTTQEPADRDSANSPGARLGHAMVYAPSLEVIALVAGAREDRVALADTWLLKEGRWSLLADAALPSRSWPGLAWDAARRELVLFGGRTGPGNASSL